MLYPVRFLFNNIMSESSLLAVLGLPANMKDFAVICRAYRQAILKTHSDKPNGSYEATIAVNYAYKFLKGRYDKPSIAS